MSDFPKLLMVLTHGAGRGHDEMWPIGCLPDLVSAAYSGVRGSAGHAAATDEVAFESIKERTVLQRIRAAHKNESGFTLVELLIVIIILGVLAGIVVFSVQAFQNRGESAACKSDYKTVETAVEAFYAQNYQYPANINALTAAPASYLKEVPNGGTAYTVTYQAGPAVDGKITTYFLWATGACALGTPAP
jgi:general secretion pathway protein G